MFISLLVRATISALLCLVVWFYWYLSLFIVFPWTNIRITDYFITQNNIEMYITKLLAALHPSFLPVLSNLQLNKNSGYNKSYK